MADKENLPTHKEIERRAYELYVQNGEGCAPEEYWLMAERELKRERAAGDTGSVTPTRHPKAVITAIPPR